jgi:hypothetical protein
LQQLAEQKKQAEQCAADITSYTQKNASAVREQTKRQVQIENLEKKIRHARVAASEQVYVAARFSLNDFNVLTSSLLTNLFSSYTMSY